MLSPYGKSISAIFIILRNSSSSANGQPAFWLPSIKLPTQNTDDEFNSKTPIHFPEAELTFPAMFGNLIDRSQNAVWRLSLEGEIAQNYENRSKALGIIYLFVY